MTFRVYFYSLKDDNEIYAAEYRGDCAAKDHLLGIYGDDVQVIWRPEKTVYEDRQTF